MKNKFSSSNGIVGTTLFRGILAVSVALHHADIFGIGYFPVILGRTAVIGFFLLSGWVVAWGFYAKAEKIDLRMTIDFYVKRMIRLFPVIILNFLLVSFIAGKILLWDLSIIFPLGINPPAKVFNHVLWALFVIIQFYIVAPVFLKLFSRERLSWTWHVLIYFTLFIVPRIPGFYGNSSQAISILDSRSLLGNFCYFYAGCWYCRTVLLGKRSPFSGYTTKKLFKIIILSFSFAAVLYPISIYLYFIIGVHAAILGSLVVIEVSRRVGQEEIKKIHFSIKPFYLLGIISYGYYVYHGIILEALISNRFNLLGVQVKPGSIYGFVFIVLIPIIIAAVSYYFIEKRVDIFLKRINLKMSLNNLYRK